MQTFLPYQGCQLTALVLDYRRLGKQRVEAWQIYQTLIGNSKGWRNHPAVLMWKGYEEALLFYGWTMSREWVRRGYNGKIMLERFESILPMHNNLIWPLWYGNDDFHDSHKSNLLRKNPEHYIKYWPDVPDNLPYVWPV